ncbi:MAG: glycosyltransferase family 4 protein [Myxococcales bacterium]|nr:glycosyltransferase family 4 protein [Myxococcales bacterium]
MATALLDLTVLATNARTRGIGRYVADLALGFARAGERTDDLRVLGVEDLGWAGGATVTEDLSGAVRRLSQSPVEAHAKWAYRVRVALSAAARALSPDVLHTGHPGATPLGDPRCPRVTTCHDLIPLRFPKHYVGWRDGTRASREWLDQRRFHSAAHVIAVSESTASDLTTLLGVSPKKITVVYNGVDLTRWSGEPGEQDSAVRERLGLSESHYVLCVGSADFRKNHDRMLAALAKVRRASPDSDVVMVWAARLDLGQQLELRRAALEHGVSGALKLVGYVSDAELAALYRGAVAQLFPSRAEGFGYPVVEAMACGCPVVTSDRSSLSEIAGDAAFQVDPEDADAIADAIRTLLTHSGERERLSARGTVRARGFDLARMAEGTLEVYRQVVARARRGD